MGSAEAGVRRRIVSSRLFRNTASLYAVQLANLVLPLITFPYLARVLRPEGWGPILFAQSLAFWLALLLEYGFNLSATRMIASARDDRAERARIVSSVMGAQAGLLAAVLLCGFIAYLTVPEFQRQPTLLLLSVLYAIGLGLSPMWYFQGIESLRKAAATEVALRAGATCCIFLLIKAPSDGWIVLAIHATSALLWVFIGTVWVYGDARFQIPRVRDGVGVLRDTSAIFALRGFSGAYMQASPFILGLIAPAPMVAFFAGAERLVRAANALLQPLSQAIYPRLSYLTGRDDAASARLLKLSFLLMVGGGCFLGIGIFVSAPMVVPILLGEGYEASIPVLRALAMVPPIVALGTVLGIQWALPAGHDRAMFIFVACGAVVSVSTATLLVPHFGAVGMALAVILAELTVVAALVWLASRYKVKWWPDFRRATWTDIELSRSSETIPPDGRISS